jgi:hypothetical protein
VRLRGWENATMVNVIRAYSGGRSRSPERGTAVREVPYGDGCGVQGDNSILGLPCVSMLRAGQHLLP